MAQSEKILSKCLMLFVVSLHDKLCTNQVHQFNVHHPLSGQIWPIPLGSGNGLCHCIPSSVIGIRCTLIVSQSYSNLTAVQCLVCGERKCKLIDCVSFSDGPHNQEKGKQEGPNIIIMAIKSVPTLSLVLWSTLSRWCAHIPLKTNVANSNRRAENQMVYLSSLH